MQNAIVTKISVCGANEKLNIDDVIKFLQDNPQVELGIGVSSKNCRAGSSRHNWILILLQVMDALNITANNVAFHINGEWAKQIVETGELPPEVLDILIHSSYRTRVQLNVIGSGYSLQNVQANNLASLISNFSVAKFILPTNSKSERFINDLLKLTTDFDVLYDNSFGFGKQAENYQNKYPILLQGYAGGLSANNIAEELAKIDFALDKPTQIWVDAEGKLKTDDGVTLDLAKAQAFVTAALAANAKASSSIYDQLIPLPDDEDDPWSKYELGSEHN